MTGEIWRVIADMRTALNTRWLRQLDIIASAVQKWGESWLSPYAILSTALPNFAAFLYVEIFSEALKASHLAVDSPCLSASIQPLKKQDLMVYLTRSVQVTVKINEDCQRTCYWRVPVIVDCSSSLCFDRYIVQNKENFSVLQKKYAAWVKITLKYCKLCMNILLLTDWQAHIFWPKHSKNIQFVPIT